MAKKPKFKCDIHASFAIAFKNWREKNKLPLKKVAADLGLSLSTINLWERGKRFPTGPHFQMLTEYTGMPPCRLFCVVADKCVPAECLLALPKRRPR
ncbi:MAG: helix-turn-helix transcriptional regulator [Verrucomicrobiota bacterium]